MPSRVPPSYPIGTSAARPEWTAARQRTPEEARAIYEATVRNALRSWDKP